MVKSKEYYMLQALKEAKKGQEIDEVPIGCVIVLDGLIIARGHNHREKDNSVISHAEIEAIRKANKKLNNWRLIDCDIYITLEPCIMCMGAIIQARFSHVYYGAKDFKGGALGSSINILDAKNINHYPNVEGGILEKQCGDMISNYFKTKRLK